MFVCPTFLCSCSLVSTQSYILIMLCLSMDPKDNIIKGLFCTCIFLFLRRDSRYVELGDGRGGEGGDSFW